MQNKVLAIHPQHQKCYDITPFFEFLETYYDGKINVLVDDLEEINLQYLKSANDLDIDERNQQFDTIDKLRRSLRAIRYNKLNNFWSSVEY